MIKYFKHSGKSIYDAEIHEFDNMPELLHYLDKEMKPYLGAKDIVIGESIGPDSRIGWKSVRHVCTWKFGSENYREKYHWPQCIGYCDLGEADED